MREDDETRSHQTGSAGETSALRPMECWLTKQRTLPCGSGDDVRQETRCLLALRLDGGYVFAPAHDIEGDLPLENVPAPCRNSPTTARLRA